MKTVLQFTWSNWWAGVLSNVGLATAAALVGAWLTPRGPITTAQTLISMGAALILGLISGLLSGRRMSMLVTPLVYVAVFELARMGTSGPTVDTIHLRSTYGLIAFVLGRAVPGVLVLLPMVAGAFHGVWLSTVLNAEPVKHLGTASWIITAISALAIGALAVLVARPATTAQIPGADGQPLPGSIAELITVPIGGHDQMLMLRGRSVDNPVLLYLAGGPGGTDLGAMRLDVGLEQHFVVATWDQRGSGNSYAALDPDGDTDAGANSR